MGLWTDGRSADARWVSRVWSGRALHIVVVLGPLATSLLAAWLLSRVVSTPSTALVAGGRWIAIAIVSTIVLVAADRVFRRLLPLATLLKLTLTFPDSAPSRFKLAMRTGSTKQLQRRIDDARAGRFGDTPAEAAALVLELVAALSVHDRLTRGHSERVRAYTQMIGEEMGLAGTDLDRLRWAGLLHDIGKLLVPTEILNKPGRLTADEYDVVKLHPEYGRTMVAPLTPWLGDAARAVWEHHERWDGGGYPRGIAGGDISRAARIVSVADTYDVITSVRSYKQRTSAKEARAELARCAGTQFDPVVVRAFLNISVFPIGRVTAPASWATQVALFPAGVFSSALRGLLAISVAVGASATALGVAGAVPMPRLPGGSDDQPEPAASPTTTGPADRESGAVEPTTAPTDRGDRPADAIVVGPSGDNPDGDVSPADPPPGGLPDAPPTSLPAGPQPDEESPPPSSGPGIVEPPPVPVTVPATVPTVTVPPVTVPVTTPTVTTVTVPPVTIPPVTVPPVTVPPMTIPTVTLPPVTVPPVTVPSVTVPSVTVPSVTVPSVTVPPVTVPPVTVPPVTVPPVTVPGGLL